MGKINHYIDDDGTLHIFVGNFSVADVRACDNMGSFAIQRLIDDILTDMGWFDDEGD